MLYRGPPGADAAAPEPVLDSADSALAALSLLQRGPNRNAYTGRPLSRSVSRTLSWSLALSFERPNQTSRRPLLSQTGRRELSSVLRNDFPGRFESSAEPTLAPIAERGEEGVSCRFFRPSISACLDNRRRLEATDQVLSCQEAPGVFRYRLGDPTGFAASGVRRAPRRGEEGVSCRFLSAPVLTRLADAADPQGSAIRDRPS